MRLAKISSLNVVTSDKNRDDSNKKSSFKKEGKKKSQTMIDELNELLSNKELPFKIVEVEEKFYYADKTSGEILGALDKAHLDELLDTVKLINSEVERNLTYDKNTPSGNFLNLDI